MKVYSELAPLGAARGTAVALGFFDGVHIGHQAVIRAAARHAGARGLAPAVFTFSLPLKNAMKGGRICPESEKHRQMEALGAAFYMEPPFEQFRALSPERFVRDVLAGLCRAKAVFCGDNFTFGARAAGNVDTLKELCAPLGIEVHIVPMALYEGVPVSSSRIRAALEAGDIPAVNAMLGRPYRIDFEVRHGQGLGRTLGFPTINQVYPEGFVMPRFGIYITRVGIGEEWYAGATGLGTRPTVNQTGGGPTCETFIPGFEGQLYDESPAVEFYQYIAPSRRFADLAGLTACVQDAAARALAYFEGPEDAKEGKKPL